jgi:hypothetical protein
VAGVLSKVVSAPVRDAGDPLAAAAEHSRVTSRPSLDEGFHRWGLAVLLGALMLTIIVVVARLLLVSHAQRRLVAPVVVPGCVALALVTADTAHSWQRGFLTNDPVDRRLWLLEAIALLLVIAGVGWQRVSARRFRGALARVVVELTDSARPGPLRDALAETLGDPQLELLHAGDSGWIDHNGRDRITREHGSAGVATTELVRDGRVVGALVHRRGLLDDPARVSELEHAAGLALEHDRLHAQLQARLMAVRASRAEIVAVADAERRRLERDLHDGRPAGARRPGHEPRSRARQCHRSGARAVHGRRTGCRPRGARRSARDGASDQSGGAQRRRARRRARCARRVGAQVEITHVPAERLEPGVESAAYFAVAALASTVSGRIVVDAHHTDGSLTLDVSVATNPGELIEIEDRVAALDGRLLVEPAADGGSLVRVALPCAS